MPTIVLIRHGQASFGLGDYDKLSKTGHRQAALLGDFLKERKSAVQKVVTGAMKRHRQTADASLEALEYSGIRQIHTGWNEFDHNEVLRVYQPAYVDMAAIAAELMKQPNPRQAFQSVFTRAVQRWVSGRHDDEYKESWPRFNERVRDAFQEVVRTADKSGWVLVYTSGGVISALAYQLLHMPVGKSLELQWRMPNCAITRIAAGSSGTHLVTLNEYGFLESHEGMVTFR